MVQTHIHMYGVEVFDKLLHCFVRFVFGRAGCAGETSSEYHQLITTLFALCEFPTFVRNFQDRNREGPVWLSRSNRKPGRTKIEGNCLHLIWHQSSNSFQRFLRILR